MSDLINRIREDMKTCMRNHDAARLATIRLILAAVKQREVDGRTELNDQQVVEVIAGMLRQRQDSIAQYEAAARQDLVAKEQAEVAILQEFMPAQLAVEEVTAMIHAVIAELNAHSLRDMAGVMKVLKERLAGRADLGKVGAEVKSLLTAAQ